MSTTAPTTPDYNSRKPALSRSFTVPARAAATSNRATQHSAEIGATEGVETLFTHPYCKVIKFTSSAPSRPGSSTGQSRQGGSQPGTLPWATLTEKTMAAGPLEIYRVPGSVSFLHSGSLLHAILPRSNCWCVDGVSKFAMRVLPDTYYRIEMPGETSEDLDKVEEFKITLQKVLFYERTACPFARTFTVDLPEEHEEQPKKKRRRRTDGPAKKWKLDKAYSWRPEGWTPDKDRPSDESSGSQPMSDDEATGSISSDDQEELLDQVKDLTVRTPARVPSVRERAQGINLRSVTAPPQLSLQSTPPSKLRSSLIANALPATQEKTPQRETPSGSKRNIQQIPFDMPPSPPESSTGFNLTTERSSWTAVSQPETLLEVQSIIQPRNPNMPVSASTRESSRASHPETHGLPENALQYSGQSQQLIAEIQPHHEADSNPVASGPEKDAERSCSCDDAFVTTDVTASMFPLFPSAESRDDAHTNHNASVPNLEDSSNEEPDRSESQAPQSVNADLDSSPADFMQHTRCNEGEPRSANHVAEDPFAAIQARIQARRSIGGAISAESARRLDTTESFPLPSMASSGSLRSNMSRHSQSKQQQPDQALATALVKKAYATFLGPPAHLVLIMLKIAARMAKGAFPKALLFESPTGMPKYVPGSFDLDDSDIGDFVDSEDDQEDDFGVPLRGPIRIVSSEAVPRIVSDPSAKERKGWSLET